MLGIGGSFDMREILEKMKGRDARALLAFDLYVYRLRQAIGALTASLDGLDALCFTGGIGENAVEVRTKTVEGLKFLGMELDRKKNLKCEKDGLISSKDSKIQIFVIHVREDWLIAKETISIIYEN